jgi:hypothetical protein
MQINAINTVSPSNQELLTIGYQRAVALINQGKSRSQIETELKSTGLSQESVSGIVNHVFGLRKKANRDAASKNLVLGALWCVGGAVVTIVTYQIATESGGGTYFVAWGAVLFGGIQFLRGLGQLVVNL